MLKFVSSSIFGVNSFVGFSKVGIRNKGGAEKEVETRDGEELVASFADSVEETSMR